MASPSPSQPPSSNSGHQKQFDQFHAQGKRAESNLKSLESLQPTFVKQIKNAQLSQNSFGDVLQQSEEKQREISQGVGQVNDNASSLQVEVDRCKKMFPILLKIVKNLKDPKKACKDQNMRQEEQSKRQAALNLKLAQLESEIEELERAVAAREKLVKEAEKNHSELVQLISLALTLKPATPPDGGAGSSNT